MKPKPQMTLVAAALLGSVLTWTATAHGADLALPNVSAKTLTKETFAFPNDATGDPAIGIFVYTRDNQEEVNRLLGLVLSIDQTPGAAAIWEFPVIEDPGWMIRGFINGGMRRGVDDDHRKAHTVTLYVEDIEAFRQTTQLTGEESVWMVLFAQNKTIARAALSHTFQTTEAVEAFINPATSGPADTAP